MAKPTLSCEKVFQISGEYPEFTFVEQDISLTKQIIHALEAHQVVVVRGASKSGKTLLVTHALRFVTFPKIWLRGGFISDLNNLAEVIIQKVREIEVSLEHFSNWEALADVLVAKRICLIIDDFHYLTTQSLRFEVWRLIKALNDKGVSIIIIGVQSPQMRDVDESDLLGRVLSVQISDWTEQQLSRIGNLGFNKLGITALNLARLVQESFTSPFLVQLLCLLYCQQKAQTLSNKHIETIEDGVIDKILPLAANRISYLNTYTTLVKDSSGVLYTRHDQKTGSLSQLILYAIAGQYPIGSIPLFEVHLNRLFTRTLAVIALDERDRINYSDFISAVENMVLNYYVRYETTLKDELTRHDPAIDLIGHRFYIRDPFLLFYLRHSLDVEEQFG